MKKLVGALALMAKLLSWLHTKGRAPSAPILALVTAPDTTGEASRRPKIKPSREVAQLASQLSVTFKPYLRKKPFFQPK